MTDLELVQKCAERMGYSPMKRKGDQVHVLPLGETIPGIYWPLEDDAQAMALGLAHPEQFEAAVCDWASMRRCGEFGADFKRILCEFVARLP